MSERYKNAGLHGKWTDTETLDLYDACGSAGFVDVEAKKVLNFYNVRDPLPTYEQGTETSLLTDCFELGEYPCGLNILYFKYPY